MNIVALGLMSGTSLDGIDIALCRFSLEDAKWSHEILDCKTYPYSRDWMLKLSNAHLLNTLDFLKLHNEYGRFTGELVREYLNDKIVPDLISSHGHTVFHQPENGLTFQLGNGAMIAAVSGITTVCDFRNLDVALGGQGAPLVPIGDKLLFGDYHYCLNLGGFANISFENKSARVAFDICPVNIVLNDLAHKKQMLFDNNGELGSKGKIDLSLLELLNSIEYYNLSGPKSLGREWVESNIHPLLENSELSIEDQAATFYEHIAVQIAGVTGIKGNILVTGGGAKNSFLISRLKDRTTAEIVIPDQKTVDFKEALIFALLGVLAVKKEVNCLSSVTGSREDNVGGTVFYMSRYSF